MEEAFKCLDQALYIAEQTGYSRIQSLVLNSLGDLLTELDDPDSARTYFQQALTIATHLGHSAYILYASLGEARLVRLEGDLVRALHDLEVIKISQSHLGPYERALLSLERGRCLLEFGQIELAVDALQNASTLFLQGEYHIEQQVAELWLVTAMSRKEPTNAIARLKEIIRGEKDWLAPTPLMLNAGHALKWLIDIKDSSQSDPVLERFFVGAEQTKQNIPKWKSAIRQAVAACVVSATRVGNYNFWQCESFLQ